MNKDYQVTVRHADVALLAAAVIDELMRARDVHAPMFSAHEGYAIIKEEFDELWDEVKKRSEHRVPAAMTREAVQLAAMAMRFVLDLYPGQIEVEIEGGDKLRLKS